MLSIVIIVGEVRERAAALLGSLHSQPGIEHHQILVLDTAPQMPPLPYTSQAHVSVIPMPATLTFGELRARAIEYAAGDYVAFLEEHALVRGGWLAGTTRLMAENPAGIAPVVCAANPHRRDLSWMMSIINYTAWRFPVVAMDTVLAAGHNTTYRRDVLQAMGEKLRVYLQCEPLLQWELARRGQRIRLDPEISIIHLNEARLLDIFRGFYHFHRTFGNYRVAEMGWGLPYRLLRSLGTPLVVPYRYFKVILALQRTHPHEVLPFMAHSLPASLIFGVSAIGMMMGYLFGKGESEARFTHFELQVKRDAIPEEYRLPA